jgi:folate-dependent phosphoribosylglycinamide formyltransferase PurN
VNTSLEFRIGLLGMPDNISTQRLLQQLAEYEVRVNFVVYWKPSLLDLLKRLYRKTKSDGILAATQRILFALAAGKVAKKNNLSDLNGWRQYFVSHHNSSECHEILKNENTDVIILATDAIIVPSILAIPRVATLNAHPAWLPRFRGLGSMASQMYAGYLPAVSVHQVNESIDTGPVFVRECFDFERKEGIQALEDSTLPSVQARLLAKTIRMFYNGCAKPIDTFAEPSRLFRGISPGLRKTLDKRLRSGRVKLAPIDEGETKQTTVRYGRP